MKKKLNPFNSDIYLEKKFLDIKEKYDINTAIETGTFHGATTIWFSENFEKVYTVECNKTYFDESGINIGNRKNVVRKFQDSPDFLKEILPLIDDSKTIIFLDAHWYTNPVLNELDSIRKSGKKPILAIHDFKVPDRPDFGYDVYPDQGIVYEWKWIESHIRSIYGDDFEIFYNEEAVGAKRGCIFIKPKK